MHGPAGLILPAELKEAPITYTIPLKKVVAYALHGTAKGPSDILRKARIKELLGLD